MRDRKISLSPHRKLHLENLEYRRLLAYSASATTQAGPAPNVVITFTGDIASDTLLLSLDSAGFLRHNRQDDAGFEDDSDLDAAPEVQRFLISEIAEIQVNALGGDDILRIDHSNGRVAGVVRLDFDGGPGIDILQGADEVARWELSGPNQGQATVDVLTPLVFSNTESIVGGAEADTFSLQVGATIESLDGSGGQDTIIGDVSPNVFQISGLNSGNVSNVASFADIENLSGNEEADAFVFLPDGFVAGSIDGGDSTNTLDFSDVPDAQRIRLTDLGSLAGYSGVDLTTPDRRLVDFDNISTVIGSTTSVNQFDGLDASSVWTVNDQDGDTYSSNDRTIAISGFDLLHGGTQDDSFFVERTDADRRSRTLNGRLGSDMFFVGGGSMGSPAETFGFDQLQTSVVIDGGADANPGDTDLLVLNDAREESDGNVYDFSAAQILRNNRLVASFQRVTMIDVLTGVGDDTIHVDSTPVDSTVRILSASGADMINVRSTASGSNTLIDAGFGGDTITVSSNARALDGDLDGIGGPVEVIGGGLGRVFADFNADGLTNLTDLNLLENAIRNSGPEQFDLNADAVVDLADLDVMVRQALSTLPGDTNLDGVVTFPDFLILSASFSMNVSGWQDGDFNADQFVGFPDFLVLSANFGRTPDNGVDTLHISDAGGSTSNAAVMMTDSQITGFAGPNDDVDIRFATIEVLELTGNGNPETFHIVTTPNETTTRVFGGSGNDVFSVETTGSGSIVELMGQQGDDRFEITSTGERSTVITDGSAGNDTFDVQGTGDDTVVTIEAGDDEDQILVRATSLNNRLSIDAGESNDTITLSSTSADERPESTLSGILGEVFINGGGHLLEVDEIDRVAVEAKGETVSQNLPPGDTLNLFDAGTTEDATYQLSPTEFDRDGSVARIINYQGIETVQLDTTRGSSAMIVRDTPAESRTTIRTQAAPDTVDIDRTGTSSIVVVETSGGDDEVTIAETGMSSITTIDAGLGQDMLRLVSSGEGSGVQLDGGDDSDVITITTTGDASVTRAIGGDGNDMITLVGTGDLQSRVQLDGGRGNDALLIQATAMSNQLQVNGQEGNDTVTFGSTAQSLGDLLGQIMVDGGANNFDLDGDLEATVTALDESISLNTVIGDTLSLSDTGSSSDATYALTATTFDRDSATARITEYVGIETINLNTGAGSNEVNVVSTPANTRSTIRTQDAPDVIQVTTTGERSILRLEANGGDDDAVVSNSGIGSIVQIEGGDGGDNLSLITSGVASGIELNGNDGDDRLNITTTGADSIVAANTQGGQDAVVVMRTGVRSFAEINLGSGTDIGTIVDSGAGSAIEVLGGSDQDQLDVERLGENSSARVDGGAANDRINVGAGNGTLDGILGTLHLVGGENDPNLLVDIRESLFIVDAQNQGEIDPIPQTPPWSSRSRFREATVAREIGDTVTIVDAGDNGPDQQRQYEIATVSAEIDRGTTITRIGGPSILIESAERLELRTGPSNDALEVFLSTTNRLPNIVAFDGADGIDELKVTGTSADDTVVIGDLATESTARAPFELRSTERIEVFGGDGNDAVRNDTGQDRIDDGVASLIAGGPGDDILIGGPNDDVLLGATGADALFGNRGNDFLFADVDFDGVILAEGGDLVFGNIGNGNDPGFIDEGVVLVPPNASSTDHIDEVENIIEEGAEKGVWSWLTARFAAFALDTAADGTTRSDAIATMFERALAAFDDGRSTPTTVFDVQPPTQDFDFGSVSESTAPLTASARPTDAGLSMRDEIVAHLNQSFQDSTLAQFDIDGNGHISARDALLAAQKPSKA